MCLCVCLQALAAGYAQLGALVEVADPSLTALQFVLLRRSALLYYSPLTDAW